MKKNLILIYALLIGYSCFAQNGYLRGKVIDGDSGIEGLFGATVTILETSTGSTVDFDGNYSVSLPAGVYSAEYRFVSYKTQRITEIEIKAGEVTSIDVVLNINAEELEHVVITAEALRDNDMAIAALQRKAPNTLDGLSSQSFKKIGDGNLASAMKRVTGVTVADGKYVYVRGLGDRYTKTSMNGMLIPGLDPDRNDVQMDMFPTAILENVVVYKTFSPELTGEFTGGMIDVQTKSFPDEKKTSVSFGLGFNPAMHFKDAISYDGSPTDFLGWDNGTRGLPVEQGQVIPTSPSADVASLTKKFNSQLGTNRQRTFMNKSFSFAHGNQVDRDKVTWGYNLIMSYKNNVSVNENIHRDRYERDPSTTTRSFAKTSSLADDAGQRRVNSVLWTALGTLSVKINNHSISTSLLHTQNGVKQAVNRLINKTAYTSKANLHNDLLIFTQRSMTNHILSGAHPLSDKLTFKWANSYLYAKINNPDYRDTRINEDEDDGTFDFKNGGGISRFWRYLNEKSENFKADFIYKLDDNSKIKLGAAYQWRDRSFKFLNYNYAPEETTDILENDPNWLLRDENIYSSSNLRGLYIQDQSNSKNQYEGNQSVLAAYLQHDWNITSKLRAIYGVRMEKTVMKYSGEGSDDIYVDNKTTLDNTNFLPSLSFVYGVNDKMNIRSSVNKTLARPSFKEKSNVFVFDPITDITFSGNIDLKQADITNYDIRWEYFFASGEKVAASLFYKDFNNHIETMFFSNATTLQTTPRNSQDASVKGIEFEFVKKLGLFNGLHSNFEIGSNISLINSRVDRQSVIVNESGDSEYDSELSFVGEANKNGVKRYRQMMGQSPYAVNAFFNYDHSQLGITANIAYNVQGENIAIVGVTNNPTVFNAPFHSLNCKFSKRLGKEFNSSLSVSVKNILNDKREMFYRNDSNGNEEKLFSKISPGRTISVSYSYTF